MYKPSGVAIVTAGLGALALFQVAVGRDTRHTEPGLQLDLPAPRVALDVGPAMQVHSGAWRAWRASLEEEPAKAPVAPPPTPDEAAGAAPDVAAAPDRRTPVQEPQQEGPSTAAPAVASGFVAFAEPAAPPAARAAKVSPAPPGEARMAHAEPKGHGMTAPASQASHAAPKAQDQAGEVRAPGPSENPFGPAIFRQFDGKGS